MALSASLTWTFNYGGYTLYNAMLRMSFFISIYLTSIAGVAVSYRLSPFHPLAAFPGPLINRITALKLAHIVYSGKRFLIIKDLHRKYGKFVRTGPNTLSINSHEALAPIYTTSKSMDKSDAYRPGRAPDGGLFFIRKRTEHNTRRRIWAAAFSNASLDHMMKVVDKRTHQMLGIMRTRRTKDGGLDLTEVIRHWAYDLMAELTFGSSSRIEMMQDGDPLDVVASVQGATVAFEILGEVPPLFDILWNMPTLKDVRVIDKLAHKLMDTRKKATGGHEDISSHLLGEHGGERLSDDELTLDSAFVIVAGSDTTAGSLTILMYHLLSDRATYTKLRDELDAHYGGPEEVDDYKKLMDLPYLFGTVHEGLRLGTPFPGLPRVVSDGGVVIDGTYVPEKTIVGVPPYVQQTSPDNFYPYPMEFKPERWQPGGLGPDTLTRAHAIMCFSYGAFSCLGKAFAIRELHLVVAKMVLGFDMELAPDFDRQKFEDGIQNMRTTLFTRDLMIRATPRH
jgi:cytochrome P450